MKKYLIRIIGSVCILAAVAVLFMPAWLEIEGLKRSELRELRSDISGMVESVGDTFADMASYSDDFKDELKDNDLPHTRSSIRKRFGEIEDLTEQLLDEKVSMYELLVLSTKAPGVVRDLENILDSSVSNAFINCLTESIVEDAREENPDAYYSEENIRNFENRLQSDLEDGIEAVSAVSSIVFTVLAAVLFLILALAVASAATHICNKGRWVKYFLLALMVVIVAVGAVCLPMVSDLIEEADLGDPFEDLSLQMTVMPYIALVLMLAPVVLDIIFERKKTENMKYEGYNYGQQF